jgi:hypothetical protein
MNWTRICLLPRLVSLCGVPFSLNLHCLNLIKLEAKSSPLVVSCFNNIIDRLASLMMYHAHMLTNKMVLLNANIAI